MTAPGEVALTAALSMLGRPYVYGAAADDQSSFDCSSLVQWAWRKAGVELPRASIDQFQALKPSALEALRAGDLVFYDYHSAHGLRYRGVNHVVMWLGDGQVVEASSRVRAVRVIGLPSRGRPIGIRRPSPIARAVTPWQYEISRFFGLARIGTGLGGWALERSGRVVAVGDTLTYGSMPNDSRRRRAAAIASTPSGRGYWVAATSGAVHAFGDAGFWGHAEGAEAGVPVVAMAATPSGRGYWLVDAAGSVHAFGDARIWGRAGTAEAGGPTVDMATTPSGRGYWLVDTAGSVHAFGDAQIWGRAGIVQSGGPTVAMAATPSGRGYWLANAGGHVQAFGDAEHRGDRYGVPREEPVVAMATSTAGGYWLVDAGGRVFTFGEQPVVDGLGAVP